MEKVSKQSHDHNFKNLFLDFPKESLAWIFPQAQETWGEVRQVKFVRQELKKHKLSDSVLILDLPILFTFDNHQLLLWLVEFQEDKAKFSIYKLLKYTAGLMESYPDVHVIPTVLFTDQTRWRKDVLRKLETKINIRLFLYFEYVFLKLFDLNARDYYNYNNPVVKILLPKMNYKPEERIEVIRKAYTGLYHLVSSVLFDKYIDFIDIYAKVKPEEQNSLYQEIIKHEETAMLAQYIREKGKLEGMQQGIHQGIQQGIQQGILQKSRDDVIAVLELRFKIVSDSIVEMIHRINDPLVLNNLLKKAVISISLDEFIGDLTNSDA